MGIYVCQIVKMYTLSMSNILYVDYISIKLLKNNLLWPDHWAKKKATAWFWTAHCHLSGRVKVYRSSLGSPKHIAGIYWDVRQLKFSCLYHMSVRSDSLSVSPYVALIYFILFVLHMTITHNEASVLIFSRPLVFFRTLKKPLVCFVNTRNTHRTTWGILSGRGDWRWKESDQRIWVGRAAASDSSSLVWQT